MNTEHTKGPWKAQALDSINLFPHLVVGADGFSPVARCIPTGTTALGTVTNEQAQANARLIASAPELLKALEIIRAIATPVSTLPWEQTPPINFAKSMDEIAKQCRAAIAKATGQ